MVVREFDDVPIICTRNYDRAGGGKPLLREGSLYVRKPGAESAPLLTSDDVRTLVGLAVRKRREEMAAIVRGMMEGQSPLSRAVGPGERYSEDRETIVAELEAEIPHHRDKGHWWLEFYPVNHVPRRWPDFNALVKLYDGSVVKLRRPFPGHTFDLRPREWGSSAAWPSGRFVALAYSGLCVVYDTLREDTVPFTSPWSGHPGAEPGTWLEYELTVYRAAELFLFMSRVCDSLSPDEKVHYELRADRLAGRLLVTTSPYIDLEPSQTKLPTYRRRQTVDAGVLRAAWEEECVRALHNLFALFESLTTGGQISPEVLKQRIDKLLGKDAQ